MTFSCASALLFKNTYMGLYVQTMSYVQTVWEYLGLPHVVQYFLIIFPS